MKPGGSSECEVSADISGRVIEDVVREFSNEVRGSAVSEDSGGVRSEVRGSAVSEESGGVRSEVRGSAVSEESRGISSEVRGSAVSVESRGVNSEVRGAAVSEASREVSIVVRGSALSGVSGRGAGKYGLREEPLSAYCWTDDLPVCCKSVVVGGPGADRKTLCVELDQNLCLYGLFDGFPIECDQVNGKERAEGIGEVDRCKVRLIHADVENCQCGGCSTARMVQLLMPAELCFGQIGSSLSGIKAVEEAVRMAWRAVDGALEAGSAGGGGCCAAVAVLSGRHLVVAGTGDVCVLLASGSVASDQLKPAGNAVPLSVCHRIDCNAAERRRVAAFGFDMSGVIDRQPSQFSSCSTSGCPPFHWDYRPVTRCLGSHRLNSGLSRNTHDQLESGVCQPIIAAPEFRCCLLPSHSCLLLMATRIVLDRVDWILESEEISVDGSHHEVTTNECYLANMVLNQLCRRQSLQLAAQAVLRQLWEDSGPPPNAIILIRHFSGRQSVDVEGGPPHSTCSSSTLASSVSTCTDLPEGPRSRERSPAGPDAEASVVSYVDFSDFYKSADLQNDDWWKTLLNA